MASRVLVALRVAVSPERAFDLLTQNIGDWWRPNTLFQFTAQGPGRLAFEPGPNDPVDLESRVTRVTVEHYGWDTIPQDHVARHGFPLEVTQLRLAEWWQSLLRSYAGLAG